MSMKNYHKTNMLHSLVSDTIRYEFHQKRHALLNFINPEETQRTFDIIPMRYIVGKAAEIKIELTDFFLPVFGYSEKEISQWY